MGTCHACGKPIDEKVVGRRDDCRHCGAELHACLNCRFYDAWSAKECREPEAEPPKEKKRANFCEYFVLSGGAGAHDEKLEAQRAAAAFDALFSKK